MTDLLNSAQKSSIHAVLDNIHDTFSREIVIYKTKQGTFIDTGLTDNPIYKQPNYTEEIELITTRARILYVQTVGTRKRGSMSDGISNEDSSGLSYPDGTIRLKLDQTAYNLVKDSKKISIDDVLCQVISDASRPGPFSPNYWTVYLKKIEG